MAASSDTIEEGAGGGCKGVDVAGGDTAFLTDELGAGDATANGVTGIEMGDDGRSEIGVDAAGEETRCIEDAGM